MPARSLRGRHDMRRSNIAIPNSRVFRSLYGATSFVAVETGVPAFVVVPSSIAALPGWEMAADPA